MLEKIKDINLFIKENIENYNPIKKELNSDIKNIEEDRVREIILKNLEIQISLMILYSEKIKNKKEGFENINVSTNINFAEDVKEEVFIKEILYIYDFASFEIIEKEYLKAVVYFNESGKEEIILNIFKKLLKEKLLNKEVVYYFLYEEDINFKEEENIWYKYILEKNVKLEDEQKEFYKTLIDRKIYKYIDINYNYVPVYKSIKKLKEDNKLDEFLSGLDSEEIYLEENISFTNILWIEK